MSYNNGYYVLVPVFILVGCYLVLTPTVVAVPVVTNPVNPRNMSVPMSIQLETIDLSKNDAKDPMKLFQFWRMEAKALSENKLVDAMTISTIKQDGTPASRTVLLRDLDSDGMKIYTDYRSPKGQDIARNPNVSLVFVWFFKNSEGVLGNRQVRIEGIAEKLSVKESEAYFKSEPIMAQIRTVIQSQSVRIVDDRRSLIERGENLIKQYQNNPEGFTLTMPTTWGGYVIRPKMMEFYQGTRDALNDRIKFTKNGSLEEGVFSGNNGWVYEQLEP